MATTDRLTEIPAVEGLEFDDRTHTYHLRCEAYAQTL